MTEVVFGVGTNRGERAWNLSRAIAALSSHVGRIVKVSSVYETEPWGFESETSFLNISLVAETVLDPRTLISIVLGIERTMGRLRSGVAYESRIIDIDILFYGDEVIRSNDLVIPHPRLHLRKFVLVPLDEIVPAFKHPVLGKSIHELLAECEDSSRVTVFSRLI